MSIVTSGHDVADARIHRWCAALQDLGLTVEVLALGSAGDAPAGARVVTTPRPGLAKRAALAIRYAARARGSVVLALDPDSLAAGYSVARARRRAVVADVHEDYEALLADRSWASGVKGRAAAGVARAATALARRCDLVVVADEHVPPLDAPRRVVLRNLPYLGLLPPVRSEDRPLRAVYVGDVRASRGLWSMVEAIEQAPGWSLDVVGPISAADAEVLAARLRDGLGDRIRLHGRRPPREAWAVAAGAACGMVLLDDTPAFREAMPSKLYEYVACGIPVVVTDLPRQRDFVERYAVGSVVPTAAPAAAVAEVLNRWLGDDDERTRLRAATAGFAVEADGWARDYRAAAEAVLALSRRRRPPR